MTDTIGRALAAACDDPEVLRRLGGSIGAAAVRAHDELAGQANAARAELSARWASAARAPLPPGLRGIDPSWIEAALATLPEHARSAMASPSDPASVWLARWACAGLPAIAAIDPAIQRLSSPDDLTRAPPQTLLAWLEAVGEDQLVLAVSAAGESAVDAMARRLGRDLSAAARRIREPPRVGELGTVRAAIQRCRVEIDQRALVRIAGRALAPRLDPLQARQLAVRLRYPIGSALLVELDDHAAQLADEAPTWRALTAT
ncbi:MAG: hypothetical protein AB7O24_22725 [Kofleriaceae bacterium]